ncbi:ABC transporter ATP-binding protein [Candidatus Gracilibacteria bacterium]|jgi:NitT/TauT family transport system ATP-binding protein|nr:ABC transporter ATP-binding protein [Candidatus Gracilibacteria bacterium]
MIEIKNISHKYKKQHHNILNDINFYISDGEFVTIVGKSGCGKSTLLNIIAGYIKPTDGQMVIDGKEVNKPGKDRIVIHQGYDHFDWMSVKDNLNLINKDELVVNQLLSKVGLNDKHESFPYELSGGMKKRLSIARALAVNPKFLIMDEPFSSLDHKIRSQIYKEVSILTKELNKTVLLVTHDLDEAIELSNKIIVLSGNPTTVHEVIYLDRHNQSNDHSKVLDQIFNLKNQIKKLIED